MNASPDDSYLVRGLQQQHIVVVGGGSGIGKSIARLSAKLGARVTISSRNITKLDEVAEQTEGQIQVAMMDMTDQSSVEQWAEGLGDVDHLVISASSAAHGPFATVGIDAVQRMFDAKFFGPYRTAKAALPHMKQGGSMTFFSGVLSRRPGMNCSGLGAVNSAIEGLVRGLALELGPDIRVNCVSPGMVRSDAYAGMEDGARENMYQSTGESLPVGRVGSTEEIAEAALYLMTNGYTSGVVLDVDGGHMVRQYATR